MSIGIVFSATMENNIRPRKITRIVMGRLNARGIMNKLLNRLNEKIEVAAGRRLVEIVGEPVADRRDIIGLRPVQDKRGFREIDEIDHAGLVLRRFLAERILGGGDLDRQLREVSDRRLYPFL